MVTDINFTVTIQSFMDPCKLQISQKLFIKLVHLTDRENNQNIVLQYTINQKKPRINLTIIDVRERTTDKAKKNSY
jgi:hypothetical protein